MTDWVAPESGWYQWGDPPRKVVAECLSCGAEIQETGMQLAHAEPWCPSWTYHIAIGDALPVKWR